MDVRPFLKRLLYEDQLLREEQLRFFESLVEFLIGSKQIAPVTVIIIEHELSAIIEYYSLDENKNTAWEKSKIDFQQLRNKLYFLSVDFLNSLTDWHAVYSSCKTTILKMTYQKKPEIPLVGLLNDPALGLTDTIVLLKDFVISSPNLM